MEKSSIGRIDIKSIFKLYKEIQNNLIGINPIKTSKNKLQVI